MIRFLALSMLLACTGSVDGDTADPVDTVEPDSPHTTSHPCDDADPEIDVNGSSAPQVGDSWTVWLRCDGTLLVGTLVVRFDPNDFASLDDNVVTFLQTGTAEMTVQVGSIVSSMDVTVIE